MARSKRAAYNSVIICYCYVPAFFQISAAPFLNGREKARIGDQLYTYKQQEMHRNATILFVVSDRQKGLFIEMSCTPKSRICLGACTHKSMSV